jgi:hypothetical protein
MWHTQRGLLIAARMLLPCRSAARSGTTHSGPRRSNPPRGPFFSYAVARREAGPVPMLSWCRRVALFPTAKRGREACPRCSPGWASCRTASFAPCYAGAAARAVISIPACAVERPALRFPPGAGFSLPPECCYHVGPRPEAVIGLARQGRARS